MNNRNRLFAVLLALVMLAVLMLGLLLPGEDQSRAAVVRSGGPSSSAAETAVAERQPGAQAAPTADHASRGLLAGPRGLDPQGRIRLAEMTSTGAGALAKTGNP